MNDITNLKALVKNATDIGETLEKASEDGFNTSDLMYLGSLSASVFDIVKTMLNFTEVKAEVTDLTDAEIAELIEYFKQEFDLDNDTIEKVVETVVGAGEGLVNAGLAIWQVVKTLTSK